jgi:ABC-type multidrug transport system fused ATPase/permease subunit
MLKLAKLLRPFAGELFLAIVFLFAQAFCELNLPNYMAALVNIGVRQQRYDYIARSGFRGVFQTAGRAEKACRRERPAGLRRVYQ